MNRRNNKTIEQKKGANIFKNSDIKEKTDISKRSNKTDSSIVHKLEKNKNPLSNPLNENDKTSTFSNNIYTCNAYGKDKGIRPPNKDTISNDTWKNKTKPNDKLTTVYNKYTLKAKNLLSEKITTNDDSYISSVNMKNKYNQTEKNQLKNKSSSIINIKNTIHHSNNVNKNIQDTNLLHQKNIALTYGNEVDHSNLEKKKQKIINHPVERLNKNNDKNNSNPLRQKKNDEECSTHSAVNYKTEKNLLKEKVTKIKASTISNPGYETDEIKTSINKKFVINNSILKTKYENNSLITDKKSNDSQNNHNLKKFKRIISYNLPPTKKNKNENIQTSKNVTFPISSNNIYNNKDNIKKVNDTNSKIDSLSNPMNSRLIGDSSICNDLISTNVDSKPVLFNYNNLSYAQKKLMHPKASSTMNIKNGQEVLNKSNIRSVSISEKSQTKSTGYCPENKIKPFLFKNKNLKNESNKHADKTEKREEITNKIEAYTNKRFKNNENDSLNKKFIRKITNTKSYISVKGVRMKDSSNATINNSTDQENLLKTDNSELVNKKMSFFSPETIETLKDIHIRHTTNLNNSKDNKFFSLSYKNNNIIEGTNEFDYLPNQCFYSKNTTKNENFNNIVSSNYNNSAIVEGSGTCQDGDKIHITAKPMDSTDSVITSNIESGLHGVNRQNYILRKSFDPNSKASNLFQTNKMNKTMLNTRRESVQIGLKFDEMKRKSLESFNYNTQVENGILKHNKDILSNIIVKEDNTKKQKSRNDTIESTQSDDKAGFLKKRKLGYTVDINKSGEQKMPSLFKKSANPKPAISLNPSIRNIIEKVVGKHLILRNNILNDKNTDKKENTIKLDNQQLNNNKTFNMKNVSDRLKQRDKFNPLNRVSLSKSSLTQTQYDHISSKINTGNEVPQNVKSKANMSVSILLKKIPSQKTETSTNINNILNIRNNNDKNDGDIKSETKNSHINNSTISTGFKKTNNIIFNSQIKSYCKKDLSQISNISKNGQSQTVKYENGGNNLDNCVSTKEGAYQNKKEINDASSNTQNCSQLNYENKKLEGDSSILLENHKDETKINSMGPTDKYNHIINRFINNGDSKYDSTLNNSFGNIDNILNFSKYSEINKKGFLLSDNKEDKPGQHTMTCTKYSLLYHKNGEINYNKNGEINYNKNCGENIEGKAFNLSGMLIEKECKDKKFENTKMDDDNKIDEIMQLQNNPNFEASKKKKKIIPHKKENVESKYEQMKNNESTTHDDKWHINDCQTNRNDKHSKKYIKNKTDCADLSHNEDKIYKQKKEEIQINEKTESENEKNVDIQREDKQRKNLDPNSFQLVNNKIIKKNKMDCTNNSDEKIKIVKKNKNIHTPLLSNKPDKNQNSNLKNFDNNTNKWNTKTIVSPEHVLNTNSKKNLYIENDNNNDITNQNLLLHKNEEQKEVQHTIFSKHVHNNVQNFQNKNSSLLNNQMDTTQNDIHHLSNLDNLNLKKNAYNPNSNNNDNQKYVTTSVQSESKNKLFKDTYLENYDSKIKMAEHNKKCIPNDSQPEPFSNETNLNSIWTAEEACENKGDDKNGSFFSANDHTEVVPTQCENEINYDTLKNRKKKWGKYIMSSNDDLDISLNNNDYDENEKGEHIEGEHAYTNNDSNDFIFKSFIYDEDANNEQFSSFSKCEENNKKICNNYNSPFQLNSENSLETTNKRLCLFAPTNEEKTYDEDILCDREKDLPQLFTSTIQSDSVQNQKETKENISQAHLSDTNKIDHNIRQEQTEDPDSGSTNSIYRKLKNAFFSKINKYVKNDSPKTASDNNGFEHTIEEGKRKKTNQGSTSNKKSKAPMTRKKIRANCEDDPNVNIYEKHYITRRRKKNEPENDGNESKETSNIYTNGIMNIKNKKNVLENNETAKTDTEIVSQLNYSDHISIISNNQDSNHFSLKTSKMISLYDQVDAHDVSENYATNSRKENTDERLLKETIENELIIEKKEVHTKYMEIEEYPNYTKNIFDPTSFTNIDPHFDKNSKHKTRYSSNNICQENNINEKIVEPKMGIIEINNYKNASNIDESEKQIINEKNINGIDTKINLFLDKIEDNKLTDSLIKNRIEAEKLNNEIPYITNIYEEMHRSSVMPLRIEAFHSLEDQRLIYGNPDWQKYFCPLCDQKYYPPNVYVKNYIHYLNEHWKNRKNLGGYIIFPCKLEHNNNEMNPSEKKVDVGVTSYNAPKKWKKKKKKMKRNARLFIDPHYHCPLCLHLQFDDYELLVDHCTKLHKSTGADPTRTLPPSFMHTPFINNNDYYCSIKKNETDISSSDILDSDQSDNKIISESKKKGDPLFHDPPSQSDALLELNNLKKNKMKNGRISKVAFCEEIKVREYDIELSKIEKFGASIGPVFTDDKEEPEKVLGSEDSLNPSPLPNELPEQTDVASKPLDHLPISEEPLPECHSNKSVDNSGCCKKLNENKIKECAIPQNNNQIDSTSFDTKTKNNDKMDANVCGNCSTSTILNNNTGSSTCKKNKEISKNGEHTGYANNMEPKSAHLENDNSEMCKDEEAQNDNYTNLFNKKNNILTSELDMIKKHDQNNCLFRDNSKTNFLDKNESNNYDNDYVLNSTTDESTNETDDHENSNQNDDKETFTNANFTRQRNKSKHNSTNNSLSNLFSLDSISSSNVSDIIPDSKDEFEKILQVKEQHLSEILLENIKENRKENIFNQNDDKKVGQFIKKRIGHIHKNVISKYKRKIKMSNIQDQKQNETKEAKSCLENKQYEHVYIPPNNVNLTLNNEVENIPLKKVIRTKKKEKIPTQRINCRKSSRNKNKLTQ
ncbi:conserved Plasmodium protein, unknown function [Plasmodium vinckei petteri]|uniref:Uncharacterized protein n=2 Tax=Plasmodium vinckei petteri TaxID=138298 RepID=A0A6V7T4E1_PLAVN|nr:conserved Plasmodium protein, unknown function [Plasmodium vinckei petteri]